MLAFQDTVTFRVMLTPPPSTECWLLGGTDKETT